MQILRVGRIKFEIDEAGQVRSSLGALGHLEDCEKLAACFQVLFDLMDATPELPAKNLTASENKVENGMP